MSAGRAVERTSAFPFGVMPNVPVDEATDDGRGADTVNRLLLHGARYHDRDAVFLCWEQKREGWGWASTPDWRADRHSLRTALVLGQRMDIEAGDRVALWLPLGVEWAIVERGVWSIGAISVPVSPSWSLEQISTVLRDAEPRVLFAPDAESYQRLRAIGAVPECVEATVLAHGPAGEFEDEALPLEEFLDYGGVLDTAERASMWRTSTRSIRPEMTIAYEYLWEAGGFRRAELDHAALVDAIERVLRIVPPREGHVQAILSTEPDRISRALVYAGWADGLTSTAFALSQVAVQNLEALKPGLFAGTEARLQTLGNALRGGDDPSPGAGGAGGNGQRRGFFSRRRRRSEDGGDTVNEQRRTWVCVTDLAPGALNGDPASIAPFGSVDILSATEVDVRVQNAEPDAT